MKARASDICSALPGAELDHPFGDETDVWKVGGKIFALVGADGLSLKCRDAETAALLIDLGRAEPAPYLKRGGWVRISAATVEAGEMDAAELGERLRISYATVAAGLPKRLRPTA